MTLRYLFLTLSLGCATTAAAPETSPSCRRNFCDLSNKVAAAVAPSPIRHIELGPIGFIETIKFRAELEAAAEAKEPSIVVDIDSPGGSVGTMLRIMGQMKAARAGGMKIHCRVDGMAASAAAVIFETSCDVREMTSDSALLFHEPSISEAGGKEGDLRRTADSLADTNKRMAILVAPRLHMTAAQYMAWIADRDRWLSADEALAMGASDR